MIDFRGNFALESFKCTFFFSAFDTKSHRRREEEEVWRQRIQGVAGIFHSLAVWFSSFLLDFESFLIPWQFLHCFLTG
jgi:hypothetical protein